MKKKAKSLTWRKSSKSQSTPRYNCVEVARDGDEIHVRDSKNPNGGMLTFDDDEWSAFIGGAKEGEFDN